MTVCLVLAILPFAADRVSAANRISSTVGLLNPRQNMRGEGYEWMNRFDTLYLEGLNIDTKDDFGLKLVDGATIVLTGDNYIKASKAALYLGGSVTIKGSGTLTLVSDGVGIRTLTNNPGEKFRLLESEITITAKTCGLECKSSGIVISGGKMNITVDDGAAAIDGKTTSVSGGATIIANGTVRGSETLSISNANMDITTTNKAFDSVNYSIFENIALSVGDSASSLTGTDNYNGEKCAKIVSTFVPHTSSIIFGEGYSIGIDIAMLIGVIIILAAAIAVPKIIKKKKAEKIIAAREAAREAEKPADKKEKKKSKNEK